MATYDTAYCPEVELVDKNISAEDANRMCLNNTLKNPKFYCSENCGVELTCINLKIDRKKYPNKIRPYYSERIRGQIHSPNCNRKQKFINDHSEIKKQESEYFFSNNKLIFNFDVTNGLKVNEDTSRKLKLSSLKEKNVVKKGSSNKIKNDAKENRIFHTKSLKKIVELFENYKTFNLNRDFPKIYDSSKNLISFDDLFKSIRGCEIDNNKYYIYHGQAYAKEYNENGLILRFTGTGASLDGIKSNPSVIVWKDEFESNRQKGVYEELKKYAARYKKNHKNKDSYFELYFLGKFIVVGERYINFKKNTHFPQYLVIRKN